MSEWGQQYDDESEAEFEARLKVALQETVVSLRKTSQVKIGTAVKSAHISYLGRMERGEFLPGFRRLVSAIDALDVTPLEFMRVFEVELKKTARK